jgi:hypothetical protein
MNSRIVITLALLLSFASQLIGADYCFIKFGLNTSDMYPYYEPVCGRSPDSYLAAEANAEAIAKAKGLKDPIGGWEVDCSYSKCVKVAISGESTATSPVASTLDGNACGADSEWEVEFTVYCTNGTSIPPVRMPGNSYRTAYCAARKAALQIAEFSGCSVCCCTSKIIKRPPPICCPIICR